MKERERNLKIAFSDWIISKKWSIHVDLICGVSLNNT